eukprot:NODE_733_length_4713_cov_0.157781.p3 type:complete len:220 gc:universal NODE_733_length_4713_cov_0.157781:642-1301(+)
MTSSDFTLIGWKHIKTISDSSSVMESLRPSWESLIEDIGYHLKDKPLNEVDINSLDKVVSSYRSNIAEWGKYSFFDSYKYTRNLVDDGNDYYNILILCWGPNHYSPIHDHANSHCLMKVLDGELEETMYTAPTEIDEMKEKRVLRLKLDQTTYIHDKIGIHKVGNPSATHGAVSLHIYSPPIKVCRTFTSSGDARKSGNCPFFSVFGERSSTRKAGLEQ